MALCNFPSFLYRAPRLQYGNAGYIFLLFISSVKISTSDSKCLMTSGGRSDFKKSLSSSFGGSFTWLGKSFWTHTLTTCSSVVVFWGLCLEKISRTHVRGSLFSGIPPLLWANLSKFKNEGTLGHRIWRSYSGTLSKHFFCPGRMPWDLGLVFKRVTFNLHKHNYFYNQ